jgi:hypothetical protein
VNYWVGAGDSTAGGYTHLFNGSAGAWTPRPAAADVSSFYQAYGVVCPSGWTCTDVGNATSTGSQSLDNGTWTIEDSGGGDIWGTADQFYFDWQTFAGDGSVSAQVTTQTNIDPWAKAGVMLRGSTDPGAPFYAALVTPGNGFFIEYRTAQNAWFSKSTGVSGMVPRYLKISRGGSTFSAYSSSDGSAWTLIPGSTITLNLPATLLAGLAVTAHSSGVLSAATVDNVVLSPTQAVATATSTPAVATPTPTPTVATRRVRRRPGLCPSTWSCVDIGNPIRAGNQSLAGGVWTMQGSGDIWGSTDQFHFDWRKLRGNGSVSARVLSQTKTNAWAKAGVMLRAGTEPGAPFYAALVTPGNGFFVEYRAAPNAWFTQSTAVRGTVPRYLKITRDGGSFSAYGSSNGSTWRLIPGSTTTLKLPATLLGGLAVTSHVGTVLGTVKIDHVVL